MTPTPEQLDIYAELVSPTPRNLIIEAVAGAGKTSTIVNGAKLVPMGLSATFLAFNKNIATELSSRLPVHVPASTFHSHAFKALTRSLPSRPKIDADKTKLLLQQGLDQVDFDRYFSYVIRLVSYAKAHGLGPGGLSDANPTTLRALCTHFNHYSDDEDFDEDYAFAITTGVLADSAAQLNLVDFDDMLWLALLRNVTFDKSQYLFVDEGQDTNAVQVELLSRMRATQGRLIVVGDPHQSIYGFRGAGHNALDVIKERFTCHTLPLSVSFRCSKAVVREAQRVLQN